MKHLQGQDDYYEQKIVDSSEAGDVKEVGLLISQGVDPTVYNDAAIRVACGNGHIEVVKLLLADPRVDPTTRSNHCILVSIMSRNIELFKIIISDYRIDVGFSQSKALITAISYSVFDMVRILLRDPGIDPNEYNDQYTSTPADIINYATGINRDKIGALIKLYNDAGYEGYCKMSDIDIEELIKMM